MDYTPRVVIRALESLSKEPNGQKRHQLLQAGLTEMIKWFTLAAKIILEKKIQLPKQTLNFMNRNQNEIKQLADANVDVDTKRKLILKPGGSGFLGGVMIRSLLRWDGHKTLRKFDKPASKKKSPVRRKSAPKKKKSPVKRKSVPRKQKKAEPLKVKFQFKQSDKSLGKTFPPPHKKIDDRFVTKRRKSSPRQSSPKQTTPLRPLSRVSDVIDQISPVRSPLSPISIMSGFQTPSPMSTRSKSVTPSSVLNTPKSRYHSVVVNQHDGMPYLSPSSEWTATKLTPSTPKSRRSSSSSFLSSTSSGTPSWASSPSSSFTGMPTGTLARFSPLNRQVSMLRSDSISDAARTAFDALQSI